MQLRTRCPVLLLMVLLGLSGCVAAQSRISSAGPSIKPILLPHRPLTTVVTCGSTNARFDRRWYVAGNQLLADMLDAAIEPNADGLTAYITLLDSRPYDPASTPLVVRIPAVPAQPAPPALTPTPTPSSDPYLDARARITIEQQNTARLHAYEQALEQQDAALERVRQEVKQQTNALRRLSPPVETAASSVFGCLALASDRLAGVPGDKWLLIWSDLRQTSWQDYLPPSTLALRDVRVRVLFMPCVSAAQCRCVKAYWGRIFREASAHDVAFFDPAQSLTLSPFFSLRAT